MKMIFAPTPTEARQVRDLLGLDPDEWQVARIGSRWHGRRFTKVLILGVHNPRNPLSGEHLDHWIGEHVRTRMDVNCEMNILAQ